MFVVYVYFIIVNSAPVGSGVDVGGLGGDDNSCVGLFQLKSAVILCIRFQK